MKNPPKKLPQGSNPSAIDKLHEAKAGKPQPSHVEESELRVAAYSQQFSGPLPHPETLRAYDAIVPGAGKDIIQSFINEGEHRRALQSREATMCEEWSRADVGLQKRGQILGFIIAIVGVGGGLSVAATVSPAAGAAVSGVTLLGIVAAFLRQRNMTNTGPSEDDKPEKPATKK